jgi:ribosomal-protein-alanine N-acetyltransferase
MLPEDVPVIAGIEQSSFTAPWSETSFYSEVYSRYSITRVAELDGLIVGYICVKQIVDECHLLDIATHPDYRRQGIATMLLNNVLRDLKEGNCRNMYLEVRASNLAARKLYEKFGFKTAGIRKSYYSKPEEDAIIMVMKLGADVPA